MPPWRKSLLVSTFLMLFASISGVYSIKIITLESIDIFVNQNFLPFKPDIYFQCQGEKGINLPDVKEIKHVYTFNGEESWQPLTELPDDKCKRCGVYQRNMFKADDPFDEWELCLNDFEDGTYTHAKEHQFNATFRSHANGTALYNHKSSRSYEKLKRRALVITISIVVVAIVFAGLIAGLKYWQKKKREHEQARFLKMFEDVDDMEDELGLGPL